MRAEGGRERKEKERKKNEREKNTVLVIIFFVNWRNIYLSCVFIP